jgi:hypothetical protein
MSPLIEVADTRLYVEQRSTPHKPLFAFHSGPGSTRPGPERSVSCAITVVRRAVGLFESVLQLQPQSHS